MSNVEIKIATLDDVKELGKIAEITSNIHEKSLSDYFKHSTEDTQKSFLENAIKSQWSEFFFALNNIIDSLSFL